jgi:hypothetical protein
MDDHVAVARSIKRPETSAKQQASQNRPQGPGSEHPNLK